MVTGVAILDQIEPGIPQTADKAVGIAKAKFPIRPKGSTTGPSPATLAKAEQVATLRAQGMTQKEVAEELGVARQTVSDLESIAGNKGDNIPIKSGITSPPTKPAYGNSRTDA